MNKNFKILVTGSETPDVLLFRDRDENGNELVKILAIGNIDNCDNMFACETVGFENHLTAMEFIDGYTQQSAERWCNRNKITNQ